jgi:hypothetical protein
VFLYVSFNVVSCTFPHLFKYPLKKIINCLLCLTMTACHFFKCFSAIGYLISFCYAIINNFWMMLCINLWLCLYFVKKPFLKMWLLGQREESFLKLMIYIYQLLSRNLVILNSTFPLPPRKEFNFIKCQSSIFCLVFIKP